MTTVSLNVNFMRAVREGDVIVTARVRMGRNLAFGQVERFGKDGKMVVHASTTYAAQLKALQPAPKD
jgi:acyl-coenzyme A thioesterase PaaI-like protein